eukprot:GHVH01004719.1.p1 GENE.GHVH01004719.1~~GHVH01004719.1.p1  ORF type:complete len:228 (-),score=27.38 GHVH01004719.1:57-740(-)
MLCLATTAFAWGPYGEEVSICPPGWDVFGTVCRRKRMSNLVPWCEEGVLDDGRCVVTEKPKLTCKSHNAELEAGNCVRHDMTTPLISCPLGFDLRDDFMCEADVPVAVPSKGKEPTVHTEHRVVDAEMECSVELGYSWCLGKFRREYPELNKCCREVHQAPQITCPGDMKYQQSVQLCAGWREPEMVCQGGKGKKKNSTDCSYYEYLEADVEITLQLELEDSKKHHH